MRSGSSGPKKKDLFGFGFVGFSNAPLRIVQSWEHGWKSFASHPSPPANYGDLRVRFAAPDMVMGSIFKAFSGLEG